MEIFDLCLILLYEICKIYSAKLKTKQSKNTQPNMELCKVSRSASLCLALFFCLFISSKFLSSVGSSNLQQGQELVLSNQGVMHSL